MTRFEDTVREWGKHDPLSMQLSPQDWDAIADAIEILRAILPVVGFYRCDGGCGYRGHSETRCPNCDIGVLIPDNPLARLDGEL